MQALGVDIQTIQSIVGHADTEMTAHDLHVQESIRQSAIQLFSEAFSAWKLDGNARIIYKEEFSMMLMYPRYFFSLDRIIWHLIISTDKPESYFRSSVF